jgi:hypothetical protein
MTKKELKEQINELRQKLDSQKYQFNDKINYLIDAMKTLMNGMSSNNSNDDLQNTIKNVTELLLTLNENTKDELY